MITNDCLVSRSLDLSSEPAMYLFYAQKTVTAEHLGFIN